jgi:NAD(P)-dependent dehydrogenase (short-subunit alcohol dehydrogenase family)
MDLPKTAYITGGASGIARALTTLLLSRGWHVFISDRNRDLAKQFADDHNATSKTTALHYAECDTTSWDSQLSTFQAALKALGGRIDFVAPIAGVGERKWLPSPADSAGPAQESAFVKPDLSVVDIDLTGVLYTIALAVQQFQRQDPVAWAAPSREKFRGKIGLVASVCGFYCVPSLPIYTAAKHALIGLTRSYGKLLPEQRIALSAVAPNVVRTGISSDAFYSQLEEQGLLTPMEGVMDAFNEIVDTSTSGEVFECGPNGKWVKRPEAEYLDAKSRKCCELLLDRARSLH